MLHDCCTLVCFDRKRNKDEHLTSQVVEKRREIKKTKEEELSEQKKREKEAARAYERWLYRKVCNVDLCSYNFFHSSAYFMEAVDYILDQFFVRLILGIVATSGKSRQNFFSGLENVLAENRQRTVLSGAILLVLSTVCVRVSFGWMDVVVCLCLMCSGKM